MSKDYDDIYYILKVIRLLPTPQFLWDINSEILACLVDVLPFGLWMGELYENFTHKNITFDLGCVKIGSV